MKKIVLASILAMAAVAASAQVTGLITYDGNDNTDTAANAQEIGIGGSYGFGHGYSVQGQGLLDYNRGGTAKTTASGWIVKGLKTFDPVLGVTPTAAVAYSHIGSNEGSELNFWQANLDGRYPLAKGTNAIVSYRFRQGEVGNEGFRSNRFSVGAEYQFTKSLTGNVRLHRTFTETAVTNALGISATYSF